MSEETSQLPRWERLLPIWASVFVVLLSGAGGLITWSLNAAAERAHQDYVRREQRYAALVSSLQGFHVGGPIEEKAEFLRELNLCWLYCSDEVIRAAYGFVETVRIGATADSSAKQRALGNLALAIRRDLLRREPVSATDLTPEDFKVLKAQ